MSLFLSLVSVSTDVVTSSCTSDVNIDLVPTRSRQVILASHQLLTSSSRLGDNSGTCALTFRAPHKGLQVSLQLVHFRRAHQDSHCAGATSTTALIAYFASPCPRVATLYDADVTTSISLCELDARKTFTVESRSDVISLHFDDVTHECLDFFIVVQGACLRFLSFSTFVFVTS